MKFWKGSRGWPVLGGLIIASAAAYVYRKLNTQSLPLNSRNHRDVVIHSTEESIFK